MNPRHKAIESLKHFLHHSEAKRHLPSSEAPEEKGEPDVAVENPEAAGFLSEEAHEALEGLLHGPDDDPLESLKKTPHGKHGKLEEEE